MSMMGTLGKVAMGIIVAKGVSKVMGGGSSSSGMGGLLGSLMGGQQQSQSGGGLGGLLGGLLGGGSNAAGNTQSGSGLGDLLGSLAGGGSSSASSGSTKDFSAMFSDALNGKESEPEPDQEAQAKVLLRAMVSAAKADGQVDDAEQKKILEHLGDVSEDEALMVRDELAAPLDLDGLINDVPKGLEQQVYLMSLLAIDLDSKEEAVYLDKLCKGLKLSTETSNEIHEKLGAPKLYN